MRTFATPAVLLALALTGCGGADSPTISAPDARPLARQAARSDHQSRPRALSGHCEASFEPGQVVSPGVIHQVDVGHCQLTHLGRVAYVSTKQINLVAGTQHSEITFTKRDGDVLRAVGDGTNNAPDGAGRVRFTTPLTFVGGTGRFQAATGRVRVTGEADLVNRTSALTLDGWLAYDKRD